MAYKFFGSLAYPPADDDYLFEEDEYNRKQRRTYNPANDWDEDESVERDYGDPLRLAKKNAHNWGEL
jgi:hypothetical protein